MGAQPNRKNERLPRISFCTTCMGRLHHLRQTFFKNMLGNMFYPNLEFIILDYNSADGLDTWVQQNLMSHIESGRLTYYKFPDAPRFHMSHAKNMALRLGSGDIVCSVDADNFTNSDFAFYLAHMLGGKTGQQFAFLTGCYIANGKSYQPANDFGTTGRLALRRDLFIKSGGFDEEMIGWGHEDLDFYNRLQLLGYQGTKIPGRFLRCIKHDDAERISQMKVDQPADTAASEVMRDLCLANVVITERNLAMGRVRVNSGSIGCGTVYRNFQEEKIELTPFPPDKYDRLPDPEALGVRVS